MNIRIAQSKFNFILDQYKISVDGRLKYKARSKLFAVYPNIYNIDKRKIISVEKRSNDINDLDFFIRFNNRSYCTIYTNNLISYSIKNSKGSINFYEQDKNLIGVFLNQEQIGLINKNKKVVLGSDIYDVLLNPECVDPILVMGFIIAYDCQYKNNRDSLVFYDQGNLLIDPIIKIDPNWKLE
jgi:hypothetical protein